MNYSGNWNEVLAFAEVLKRPNIQILILSSTMLNIHNHVERICYFELLIVYVKINSFVKGLEWQVMRWPRKTRPNLHSRVVAWSMIMLGSVQETTTSTWLTNVRLLAADCLLLEWVTDDHSEQDATKSTWPCLSQYCVSRLQNQNQPCHMVVYYIYELFKKMQILKSKLPNLRLNTHIYVTACRQDIR